MNCVKNILSHENETRRNTGQDRTFCWHGVNACTFRFEVTLTLVAFSVLHYFYHYTLT